MLLVKEEQKNTCAVPQDFPIFHQYDRNNTLKMEAFQLDVWFAKYTKKIKINVKSFNLALLEIVKVVVATSRIFIEIIRAEMYILRKRQITWLFEKDIKEHGQAIRIFAISILIKK